MGYVEFPLIVVGLNGFHTVDGSEIRLTSWVLVNIPLLIGFHTSKRWLFGISSINSIGGEYFLDVVLLAAFTTRQKTCSPCRQPRCMHKRNHQRLGRWTLVQVEWDEKPRKTNSSHLKMDGWNMIVSFWGPAYFQVLCEISGSVQGCRFVPLYIFGKRSRHRRYLKDLNIGDSRVWWLDSGPKLQLWITLQKNIRN